jgi:hypothetical protein
MAERHNAGLIKVCPVRDCDGYADNQRPLNEYEETRIPADILKTVRIGMRRCTLCEAVWADRDGHKNVYGFLDGNGKFDRRE